MRAVSDASVISSLALIRRLTLLKSQFAEVSIPPAVARELSVHPDEAALSAIEQALRGRWIAVSEAPASRLLNLLLAQLHIGEAEAIALAVEKHADIVLIDERDGRRLAVQAGLRVTGVLGILLRAKTMGDIVAVKPELAALRSKARFFVSAELQDKVLAAAGEL